MISEDDIEMYNRLHEPYNLLYLLSLYADPLLKFQETALQKFGDLQSSFLWRIVKSYRKLYSFASLHKSRQAIEMAAANLYHVYKLFGKDLAETMDISSALFGEINNEVFVFGEEQNRCTRLLSSDLIKEYNEVFAGTSPVCIENQKVYEYLQELLEATN